MAAAGEEFEVCGIKVLQKKISGIDDPMANYNGFNPSTTTLPQGFRKDEGRRAFPAATIWERDIEIPMRDGVILRADVFRPAEATRVPAIVAWSPYGKSGTGDTAPWCVSCRLN
jgi:predicted acyl esterase